MNLCKKPEGTLHHLNAGVDMDMVSEGFVGTLKKSVMSGKVSMKTVPLTLAKLCKSGSGNWIWTGDTSGMNRML